MKLVLSSEHGGNKVPENYQYLFALDKEVLETHRAIDLGSLDLYNSLLNLVDFSHKNEICRLIIEINRSLRSESLFSKYSKELPLAEKKKLENEIYKPYRQTVLEGINKLILEGEAVFHLSVHTFTPILKNEVRTADIAFLFDPAREIEKTLCIRLKANLNRLDPNLRVRFNYPYAGIADGFTTTLRKEFKQNYAGIELEVNQGFTINNKMSQHIKNILTIAISNALKT